MWLIPYTFLNGVMDNCVTCFGEVSLVVSTELGVPYSGPHENRGGGPWTRLISRESSPVFGDFCQFSNCPQMTNLTIVLEICCESMAIISLKKSCNLLTFENGYTCSS